MRLFLFLFRLSIEEPSPQEEILDSEGSIINDISRTYQTGVLRQGELPYTEKLTSF